MSKRLNLYLPNDHWVFEIPAKERAKRVKELLEYARDFETITNDIAEIKQILLSGGNYIPQPPVVPKNVEDADKELIMSILNM